MFGKHCAGIYEKALDTTISWEERLLKAAKLGFDYLEISIDETDERLSRLDWDKSRKKEFSDTVWRSGVKIRSMCLSAHRRFPFGSADVNVRRKAGEITEKAINFAGELGIRVIQLAGYDVYYEPSTADSVKRFAEGMEYAADLAERAQVMLGMEIMDTPFMNSVTKYLKYENAIRSPWYKLYPDLGNLSAWTDNNPAKELEKGIGSIVAVHLKDTLPPKGDFKGQFRNLEFGKGCVNFAARFCDLERLGYKGPYTVETWYKQGTDDVAEIKKACDFLQTQYENGMKLCWKN
ncbi:MAG: L-ribulose-5-phosphate 3-epimerase [Clostridia bacterium]|nr:L-ribulose-5-phosphate 3-epimerase [Clostridia bacterium]